MQQHPLPQNISSYEFHLIGDMTLKQFLYLVAGLGGAWFLYSLPLSSLFKWPLVGLSAISGIAFAFLPYQDRPLDQWLVSFIRAIYHPTQFIWKKSPKLPDFLQPSTITHTPPPAPNRAPTGARPLASYLQSLPEPAESSSIDQQYTQKIHQVTQLFSTLPVETINPTPLSPIPEKTVRVRVRKLITLPPIFTPQTTTSSINQAPTGDLAPPPLTTPTPPTTLTALTTPTPTVSATVNVHLPFPQTPTVPNVIVGMTLDNSRNILDNTILEIRDVKNHPVRALKSNKLGQFFIATPLPNGIYEIEVERPGFAFDSLKITLDGNITPPLEIRAKPLPSPTHPLYN